MAGGRRRSSSVFEVDPTNRNTALASALSSRSLRGPEWSTPAWPRGRARLPSRWRSGTSLRIAVWTHVDERCAGFFAIGIAQRPGGRRWSSPRRARRRRTFTPQSRRRRSHGSPLSRSPPTDRPSCEGAAPVRRSTRSSCTGRRCAGSASWVWPGPTDEGLLHYRSVAARAVAEARAAHPARCISTWRIRRAARAGGRRERRDGRGDARAGRASGWREPITRVEPRR